MRKVFRGLKENFGLKVVSLLIGIIVWFNATTDEVSVFNVTFNVQYSYDQLGDSLIITSHLPENIRVLIKTTGKNYLKLKYSKNSIHKNLQNIKYGINEIKFDYGDIPVSLKDVEIFNIYPQSFFISVDRIGKKAVPVKISTIITQSENLYIKQTKIYPESAFVSGPLSMINNIKFLLLEPIKVKKISDTIFTVSIENFNEKLITLEDTKTYSVFLVLDTLISDSISIKLKDIPQRVTISYWRPTDFKPETKHFKISKEIVDSTAQFVFYKINVETTSPLKVKSVEPEMISIQRH